MDFYELIKQRQSCRGYQNTPVEAEKIQQILQASASSPSACNSQPWHYVVVDAADKLSKMPAILQTRGLNRFADNVPVFVVICETKATLKAGVTCDSQHYAQMDVGLTTAHMVLAAKELGLSSCIMGSFDEAALIEMLAIPSEAKIRLVVAIGYSQNEEIRNKVRKNLDEVCSYNHW